MDNIEKSRTQEKLEARYLQKLGETLVKLSLNQLKSVEMPDELKNAVLFAKTINSNGAKKRQMQYIGTIMRDIDPEPIVDALKLIESGHAVSNKKFHQIEKWRDQLIQGENAVIEEIMEHYPHADRQRLRQLARNSKKEFEKQKPPKSSRMLFKYLGTL